MRPCVTVVIAECNVPMHINIFSSHRISPPMMCDVWRNCANLYILYHKNREVYREICDFCVDRINFRRWATLLPICGCRILEHNKIKKTFLLTRAIEWGPPLNVKALPVTANGGRCRALKMFF